MTRAEVLEPILVALRQRLDVNQLDVPMLPEVAGRVIRLTQDPDSDAAELSKLMQSDQTLAAHVMHIANSAAYSPNVSIVSLQQAITRLGMKAIAEIALAVSINSSMFDTPGFEKHVQRILHRSVVAALWAKEVARACRKNVEAAFLAGLLHDMGRPVAVQCALQIADELDLELTEADVLEVENQTQRDIGIHVLEQWEMPSAVRDVVSYFDQYQQEHSGQVQTMIVVAGAAIAEYYIETHGVTCFPDQQVLATLQQTLISHPVFASINLYPDEITALLDRAEVVQSALEAMAR